MKKLELLRNCIIERLSLDGADVTAFCEDAQVINYYKKPSDTKTNSNFKLQYEAKIFIANFSGDINAIAFVINQWMGIYCANHGHNDLSFEIEILDHQNTDVLFTLKNIEETVKVEVTTKGVSIKSCDDSCHEIDSIVRPDGIVEITEDIAKKALE